MLQCVLEYLKDDIFKRLSGHYFENKSFMKELCIFISNFRVMLKYHEIHLDIVTLDLKIQHCFLGNYY